MKDAYEGVWGIAWTPSVPKCAVESTGNNAYKFSQGLYIYTRALGPWGRKYSPSAREGRPAVCVRIPRVDRPGAVGPDSREAAPIAHGCTHVPIPTGPAFS